MTQQETQNAIPIRKRSRGFDPFVIVLFIIPCLQFVQVNVIGVISISEFLLLITFIYFAARWKIRIVEPVGIKFLVLCALWLTSQCVTDIVRRTAFADYARGWSNIGMTLVNFAVLWTLMYGRPQRLVAYGWGLVVGGLLTFYYNPDEVMIDNPWKFGISYPVTLAVFLIVSNKKWRGLLPIALITLLGLVNISLDSRNRGGVCLFAALYLFSIRYMQHKGASFSRLKTKSIVAITGSVILGIASLLWAYQYAASAGMLGDDARKKYEGQSSGKYGVLLGGRTEMLGSLPAIYDSPLLGHGSWARDPIYRIAEIQSAIAMGYEGALNISPDELTEGNIPTHSYIFGAWVDAGFLGAFFWGWVFVLIPRVLMQDYTPKAVLLPVVSFMAFSMLWDILFSPYGSTVRIIVPYYVVMMATCMSMAPLKDSLAASNITGKRDLIPH